MSLSLSDDDDEGSYSSTDDSSSGDDGAHQHLQSQSSVEVEIDHDAEDAGSQVSFDTMEMSDTDFLTPGGLNSFSVVALPVKRDKLVLKDLPKTTKASGVCKKNFKVTVEALNVRIEQLRTTAVAENASARSIYDVASNALKRGSKSLDNVAKKMAKLEDDLSKSKSKLSDVSEKLRVAIFDQDATSNKVKTTSNSLKVNTKELAKVKKELADAKKEMESAASRNTSGISSKKHDSRGDSMERLREKELIKLQAYEEKSEITRRVKAKEERRKRDAKHENVSTIQALGGRDNPFVRGRSNSSRSSRRDRGGRHNNHHRSRSTSNGSSRSRNRSESRGRNHRHRSRSRSETSGERDRRGSRRGRGKRRGRDHSRSRERSTSRGRDRSRHRERSESRGRDSKRRHSRSRSRSKSKGFAPVAPRGFAGGTLELDDRDPRDRAPVDPRGFAGGTLERAGGITHACYDPPLPNPNNQLNQLEDRGLSYSNSASGLGLNVNDENYAAEGLLKFLEEN
jgi:hypothetical protein